MSILSEFLTMLGVQDDFCIQLISHYWKSSGVVRIRLI
ncbi:MAG: hypothetical protein BECKG1743D_GA0114223_102066 [Candidatus Kentron sp. G]|nr:MAG: hypothetical protein BECKG1743F_GA0114225_100931 [Candidatus Kentron sp. G]VFM95843.1 MAG: hypothetical protein BECKG1743E_GA0114224_100225 [Candidatus Kentron sp. G]VFN00558.1 MAG: hypothetical protein BECKG1743D_GA0114223_102066 [Candidatus Kentron sp. G]